MANSYVHTAVGGSDIKVILEFPTILIDGKPGILEMASAITVSYSVYRAKANVYNLGQPILNGLAVGRKYVAGSIITVAYEIDEISNFINTYLASESNKNTLNNELNSLTSANVDITNTNSDASFKSVHTVMRDDLTPFNIYFLMSSENDTDVVSKASRIIVYGAQFINNGQVMSIDDIITENTLSFIAQDVREQHPITDTVQSLEIGQNSVVTASSLLNA